MGHLLPVVPLARELQGAGHEVVVATAADFTERVEDLGLPAVAAGVTVAAMTAARAKSVERSPAENSEDPARSAVRRFARLAPAMLGDLVAVCENFRPDLIVHEEAEMAGPLAARIAGVPNVNHSWASPIIPGPQADLVATEVESLWREYRFRPEPAGGRYRHLHIDTCPPCLQGDGGPHVGATQLLRPTPVHLTGQEPPPKWLERIARRPTVYVTLGTVPLFNSAALFAAAIDGLRDEPVEVVVSVWRNNDPAQFGPQPANVHVERDVDQTLVLPHCVVAVVHGGPGSTVGALAHGVPVLVVPPPAPIFARVRDGVIRAGAGRTLAPVNADPASMCKEVRALIENPSYRQAARRVADEIAAMPSPREVVPVVEQLVRVAAQEAQH